ncbi:MAG: substrate-binding domain-containing protein [Chitinophagales bacterium]|nr:substrate-binding domain-containing protein [Chitinophagales bacterium]
MKKICNSRLLIVIVLLSFIACNDAAKIEYYPSIEEKNTGKLQLYCDEQLRPILEQQIEVFEHYYPQADIQPVYMPERDIITFLLSGKARTSIIMRKLSDAEKKQIETVDSFLCKEHIVAKSALALVSAKSSRAVIPYDSFITLFNNPEVTIVLEGKKNDRLAAISKALNINQFGKNIFAMENIDSVLYYVNRKPKTIGIIDYSHIADEFSSTAQNILKQIEMIKISRNCFDTLQIVYANPNDIFTGCYPLVLPINYVNTDYRNKLSLGFVNFLVKNKASKVFLRGGYIPAVMPQREILIDTSSIVE